MGGLRSLTSFAEAVLSTLIGVLKEALSRSNENNTVETPGKGDIITVEI